ncbi:MAG: imidazolonepropionase [Calditrichaeota bacterium]|nr:imidazolonepropionase [Calditrichota bacterium]
MPEATCIIENARQIIRFENAPKKSDGVMGWDFQVLKDSAIAIQEDRIAAVGNQADIREKWAGKGTKIIDAAGRIALPGFVDSHTHPVFMNTREREFEMRLQGRSYEDIAAAGGGIRASIQAVRKASKEDLLKKVLRRMDRFLELGTTTVEAKSGYGLSYESEIKSLEVLREADRTHPVTIVPTFLGAHEMPDEYRHNREDYIRLLTDVLIPAVAKNHLAKFCDVYCEQGVYSPAETLKICVAAREAGLGLKIHADQFHAIGCTELAAELGALSVDHLEQVTPNGVEKLRKFGSVATLLPGSVFFIGSATYPPARRLIEAGVPVALATDFNPGSSMTQSMALMTTFAGIYMKMTPAEALVAATIHGAKALRMENEIGNLAVGYKADIVLWDADDYRMIPYYFGGNLVSTVIKSGQIVYGRLKN